jgi:ASC-1-like (ASCH) protein
MSIRDATIIAQVYSCADRFDDWRALAIHQASTIHIAVMSEPFLSYVFEGKKTVESRFSLHKIAPYQKVQPGDIVFLKAGPIVGCFRVGWCRYFDLTKVHIEHIATTYGEAICADKVFWQQKADKHYATLLGISEVRRLTPLKISKFDRRAWITLTPQA